MTCPTDPPGPDRTREKGGPGMSYLEKRAVSLFGKTIHEHALIGPGDKILAGLSGGKDSLVLVHLLALRRERVPIDFEVAAGLVDLGFPGLDREALKKFCRDLGVGLEIRRAEWSPKDFDSCYPCARLRRKALFEMAARSGCNKVALGHHLDDLIESHLLGLVYNARAEIMEPCQEFMEGALTVVRPLLAVPESSLARLARTRGLPVQENPCPLAETSARAEIRRNIKGLLRLHPKSRQNILKGLRGWMGGIDSTWGRS